MAHRLRLIREAKDCQNQGVACRAPIVALFKAILHADDGDDAAYHHAFSVGPEGGLCDLEELGYTAPASTTDSKGAKW